MGFTFLSFGLIWDSSSFSFWFFSFGTGMSIPCFSHHCILEAHNLSGFKGSQMEKNFIFRVNHILSLIHIWFRWDFGHWMEFQSWFWNELRLLGDVGMEWIWFVCDKDMIWSRLGAEYYGLNCVPPKCVEVLIPIWTNFGVGLNEVLRTRLWSYRICIFIRIDTTELALSSENAVVFKLGRESSPQTLVLGLLASRNKINYCCLSTLSFVITAQSY